MVTITIIGWYGTETIGDRAIFAGLLHIFSQCFDEYKIKWGSLIPHFTERTLLEDKEFYQEISNQKLKDINIFDSLNVCSLKDNIKNSDILAIGGGPLMDIQCMFMLEYAFKYANRKKIPAFILGCGWGPLKNNKYIKSAKNTIKHANLTIFRDNDSLRNFSQYNDKEKTYSLIDPAIFAAQYFIKKYPLESTKDYIAINFRDIKIDNIYDSSQFQIKKLSNLVSKLSIAFPDKQILLVPMHTFSIGGDDRIILEEIHNTLNGLPIQVQHKPLSLKQTMEVYRDATLCIGMRFHSILLQLIVNGYNYILDYTDPSKGKIIGLIRQLELESNLKNRYSTVSQIEKFEVSPLPKIIIDDFKINQYLNTYTQLIKETYENRSYKHK